MKQLRILGLMSTEHGGPAGPRCPIAPHDGPIAPHDGLQLLTVDGSHAQGASVGHCYHGRG